MRASKQGEIYGGVSREEFLREPLTIARLSRFQILRLSRMCCHLHHLLKQIRGAVTGMKVDDLSEILKAEILIQKTENISNFERQSSNRKVAKDALAVDEMDSVHVKVIEFEELL